MTLVDGQLEVQKSKEAGAELQNLSAAMNDIQDTLGGGLVRTTECARSDLSPPRRMARLLNSFRISTAPCPRRLKPP